MASALFMSTACPPPAQPVVTSAAVALAFMVLAGACARAPRMVPPPPPTSVEKLAWILRLEDQRVLRDPPPPLPVVSEEPQADPPALVPPRPRPDLFALLVEPEAWLRRRAALAVGRVGLTEGVGPLVECLADAELEVRQMAAFALGLIGDVSATEPLMLALADPSPKVQGRAAAALGRMGAAAAAPAIGEMVRSHVTAAFDVDPEDLSYPQSGAVEAFRLGLYALADLKAFEPLARAVLDENGQPILWWWPVAYALQRMDNPRALAALTTLAGVTGSVGVSLAAQGLGAIGDPRGVKPLIELLDPERRDSRVVVSAVRALGQIQNDGAVAALNRFVRKRGLDPTLRLAAVEALGQLGSQEATEVFLELIAHRWPEMRAAALQALARVGPESFMLALSGLGSDPDWRVRAAIAQALEHAEPDAAHYRLALMLGDEDQRVVPSVLSALVVQRAPDAALVLRERLKASDDVVRKTAARLLSDLGLPETEAALAEAYHAGRSAPSYVARAAALDALSRHDGPVAIETLRAALEDPDWAVRVLAAERLDTLEPDMKHDQLIRPAPGRRAVDYAAPHLVDPNVSPHAYIETKHGVIEIELAVRDAPLTSDNFVKLARRGFFDGLIFHRVVPNYVVQAGDPRSDGEGGPGYTLRDELNQLPYLRGTVGMALDWQDTGGSQFFITHSPQPHLDARYTAFGRVVAGMEVVDQIRQGDQIRQVLIWDGVEAFRSPRR